MPRSREKPISSRSNWPFNYWDYLPLRNKMNRIAVRYQGTPLMPMKSNRITKFITSGKGKIRYDRKLGLHYLQLLVEPSDYATQDITIGLDPGSSFDGFSVVSKDTHHVNIELVQRPKRGKNSIKSLKTRQRTNRRIRRSRLRHRPIRFDNRTKKNQITPTIRANVDFRKWLITRLVKMYPITRVVVEDVRYNHYKSNTGNSFSLVEQGKTELYNWIKNQGLLLEKFSGYDTKNLRINTFGGDPKIRDKSSRSFEAHCVDSFVLACNKEYDYDPVTGEIFMDAITATNELVVRKSVIFIEKIVKIRRSLFQTRKRNKQAKFYYFCLKGGIKEYYQNYSSHRNICRIKPPGEHSNHPKHWIYLDNGIAERFKYQTQHYGGTVIKGIQKFMVNNEWKNRVLC